MTIFGLNTKMIILFILNSAFKGEIISVRSCVNVENVFLENNDYERQSMKEK